MNIKDLLIDFKNGSLSIEDVEKKLQTLSYEDIGFAKIDHNRKFRKGFGEVIYGPGKTKEQLLESFKHLNTHKENVLATRVSTEQAELVLSYFNEAEYDLVSKTLILKTAKINTVGLVAICTGGTGDIPVAEEAAKVSEFFGSNVERYYDVGVAGIHRLFSNITEIRKANAIAAVAGMEGALGSVIAGLVEVPVIAIPTSIGYGASFGGLSALLTMLNSCSEGLAVVNIDNGFGGGYLLSQINRLVEKKNAK